MGQERLPPMMVMAQVNKGPIKKNIFETPATPVRFKNKQTIKERK